MSIKLGQIIPDISVPATGNQTITLNKLQNKRVVLYFYPKDHTAGCTTAGQNFRDLYPQFKALNTEIFGVSRDTVLSHEKFKDAQQFPFELLADSEQKLCTLFAVIKEKQMYGKWMRGIERSTFLFDERGILVREWRRVKVAGHAAAVLEAVQHL